MNDLHEMLQKLEETLAKTLPTVNVYRGEVMNKKTEVSSVCLTVEDKDSASVPFDHCYAMSIWVEDGFVFFNSHFVGDNKNSMAKKRVENSSTEEILALLHQIFMHEENIS